MTMITQIDRSYKKKTKQLENSLTWEAVTVGTARLLTDVMSSCEKFIFVQTTKSIDRLKLVSTRKTIKQFKLAVITTVGRKHEHVFCNGRANVAKRSAIKPRNKLKLACDGAKKKWQGDSLDLANQKTKNASFEKQQRSGAFRAARTFQKEKKKREQKTRQTTRRPAAVIIMINKRKDKGSRRGSPLPWCRTLSI